MAAAATAVVPRPAAAPAVPTGEVLVPLTLVATVVIMVVPLPPLLIDLLLALSISLGLTVLLVALYIQQPLQFSTFPSVLLVVTLFRLALNVASTRLILLHGAEGPGAAGHVIQAFGNFVVITKGSIRIAEVAARFTLDAMPGKQLAIDADLNSGLITEREARARRRAIEEEADFYGAMDGASKFVRGVFIGVVQQGTDVQTAAQTYTILTVGDGLVSQIPALLISTAAGIIVTRAASEADLGTAVTGQLFASPRVLWAVSAILGAFALLPGLPFLPFVVLAGAAGALAAQGGVAPRTAEAAGGGGPPAPPRAAERPEALLALDMMELEVGFELVPLVDAGRSGSGDLVERIKALRRQLALEMGFIVPPIHIRDNLDLKPNAYVILLKGNEVARGEVRTGSFLAINPGTVTAPVPGIATREPAFGLDALWVAAAERERAQLAGYTVVDAATVVVTHLTEVIRRHAHELLGRQEVQQLLDQVAKTRPKVVEELVPQQLSLGGVQKVLQNLLREGIPIRDLQTILETLADHAPRTKDPDVLTEHVRQALGRAITRKLLGPDGTLAVVTLGAALERRLLDALQRGEEGGGLVLEPALAQRLVAKLGEWVERFVVQHLTPVLLCSAPLRPHLRRQLERYLPQLACISPQEIVTDARVRSLGVVTVDDA